MSRTHIVLVACGSFVLGSVVTAATGVWLLYLQVGEEFNAVSIEELDSSLSVLTKLRSGNVQDVIDTQEGELDGAILATNLAAALNSGEVDAELREALTRIKEYREAYPRKSDEPHLEEVDRILGITRPTQ